MSQRAHPVIKRVHDDESNDFSSILVPFTDGRKTIQVSTDIEESVATEAKSVMKSLEKQVVLAVIDQHWKEHLRSMDDLRSNVQHARHEQKDPRLIYTFESYEIFKKMVSKVNAEVASFLMKCTIPSNPNAQRITQARKQERSPQGTTSKEGVENLSQKSSRAAMGARRGMGRPGAIAPGRGPARPQKVSPIRTEKKIGRNQIVTIQKGSEVKNLKYKKAEILLNQGWTIVTTSSD